jgi:hypothetical protein
MANTKSLTVTRVILKDGLYLTIFRESQTDKYFMISGTQYNVGQKYDISFDTVGDITNIELNTITKLKDVYVGEIVSDGYYIQTNGKRCIEQRGIYKDIVRPGKSIEENVEAHINDQYLKLYYEYIDRQKTLQEEKQLAAEANEKEQLRADIDYLLMVNE